MGNQPIYRYPPRSHASNCPCNRCVQCRSRKSPGSDLIGFDMGCLAVVLVFAAISGIAGLAARHAHAALGVLAGAGELALVICAVVYANRRAVRPARYAAPAPASGPPMSSLPPTAEESRAMAPPLCWHRNAVRVASRAWPQETLENYCPDCDTRLGAGFAWACCGAPPGDTPGAGHLYNCPHRKK